MGCGEFKVELWPRTENEVSYQTIGKNTVTYMLKTLEWKLDVIYCYLQCSGIMHSQFLELFSSAKI